MLVVLLTWPLLCINFWGASWVCCISSRFNQTPSVKPLFCLVWLTNTLNKICLFKTVDKIMWLTGYYSFLLGRKFQSLLPCNLLLRGRVWDFPILKPFLTDVVLSLALNKTFPMTDSAVQISQQLSTAYVFLLSKDIFPIFGTIQIVCSYSFCLFACFVFPPPVTIH